MAEILYGKPVAETVYSLVEDRVSKLSEAREKCTISSLRIGENPDDIAYERSILKACSKRGIEFAPIVLKNDASTEDALREIAHINADASVDGCIVFQPMPKAIGTKKVCNAILTAKDLDCASDSSLGEVMLGSESAFAPATAQAVIKLLDHYEIDLCGAHIVVVGRSRVIGKPVGMLALGRNSTVTFCHSKTRDLAKFTRQADIVVCCVGRPRFFDASYFCEGQYVIDVGMNTDDKGQLCGDVDFESVEPIVSAITPVPGGIGAITTSILLEHATRRATYYENEGE